MNHMMIDLETLATSANAVVVSVGAVVFDSTKILRTGYWVLNTTEQYRKGRAISPETVQWWMGQSDGAREVFTLNPLNPRFTLDSFSFSFEDFFKGEKLHLWGNGADFDLAIMTDMWERHSLPKIEGWKYYNHLCYRTFKTLFKCKDAAARTGTHHNALDDAKFQTECVLASGRLLEFPC